MLQHAVKVLEQMYSVMAIYGHRTLTTRVKSRHRLTSPSISPIPRPYSPLSRSTTKTEQISSEFGSRCETGTGKGKPQPLKGPGAGQGQTNTHKQTHTHTRLSAHLTHTHIYTDSEVRPINKINDHNGQMHLLHMQTQLLNQGKSKHTQY